MAKPTVLIVEDERELRDTLNEILEDRGFSVVTAANGREGLERLRSITTPCLVLLDLMLPEMSGWEFRQEQLRDADLAVVPVVIISGVADLDRSAASLQPSDLFQKPFDMDRLIEAVERLCPTG
jgi:CheY-like chemotaxis protein